jgi:hypothetical protein
MPPIAAAGTSKVSRYCPVRAHSAVTGGLVCEGIGARPCKRDAVALVLERARHPTLFRLWGCLNGTEAESCVEAVRAADA